MYLRTTVGGDFGITDDGDIYRLGDNRQEYLGHIGCILHLSNRSTTAREIRKWWNGFLASREKSDGSGEPGNDMLKPSDVPASAFRVAAVSDLGLLSEVRDRRD